ncbi:MBL fold metallo-hydrolase [Enemella evansiae]|uniref:MBL fold metallo-hydrolase n=1 Tax=Enemella evansiae TaxID=2016499 RepID=UPI000B963AA2|nr:MBL fold metallo-hydrolase [Enemella evansiae]PFG67358.1 glyoxylase-like metal-dependent hydrolase (beta-lactamase superfamily II) [Propionibacteriaceae bacterium ES.041]OYN98409.1 MBL fold metallo-hydrolase [Enemella evansiae]OYN99111.1 MBL fold metallo-hydrolase [Enemella evansiae]OYO05201.1 MBL fold metallo-hydrolase [Enemella evansiae]OYO15657.1 MBL fold metallo-hydrolase [Enemella evansiae]
MLIASFPAGPFQTNCYVVAAEEGGECIVIDPGMGAAERALEVVAAQRLSPVAVIATHGHIDHVASVAELCAAWDVPAYIHPADRDMLAQRFDRIGIPGAAEMLRQLMGTDALTAPQRVHDLVDGTVLELAGLPLTLTHAPGHTPGSTLLTTPYAEAGPQVDRIVFSGDVLFAGSIGRTDLPGGSHPTMLDTLRTRVLPLSDTAAVLPGHGAQTTMARERATNPYLQPAMLAADAGTPEETA